MPSDRPVLIEYLPLTTDGEISIEQIQAAADRWVGRQPQPPHVTDARYGRMRFISDARQGLNFLGRLRRPEAPRRPYTPMLEDYTEYMAQEQGLSPHTIGLRCWHREQFLGRFWQQQRPVDQIGIGDSDAAIARKGDQDGYARASLKSYVTVLRAFFRYAEHRRWCSAGLAAAIMSPRLFTDALLPKGPAWEDVQRLLASTQGDRPKDSRDRAIIMLFAVYGLRVGEVRTLRLEDLDWERELIYVTRPKSRCRQTYPLSYTVGEAILRYLKDGRPQSPHREIFLTVRAPIVPLSNGVLYDVVAERLRPLALPLPHYGPHALRHAGARRLLGEGLSMNAIGDHLGHRKADTTRGYANVDLAGLRQVADFDLRAVL